MFLQSLVVFAGTLLLIRLIISQAETLGLIDTPNHRSAHDRPIPRGAGIAFVLSALGTLLLFHPDFLLHSLPLVTGMLLILAVGILDDRHDASPRFKFVVVALATLILWEGGYLIDDVGRYFGVEIRFGVLAVPFTFFALAGFTNAMNLIDGLDGLAGTLSLLILGSFLLLGIRHHDAMLLLFSSLFMAGLVAFLLYNWHPAAIFMGDSGSLTLGFLISVLSIRALDYLPSVAVLYLGAVPILDTLVVMIRRKLHGRSATAPDHCHLHHLLLRRSGSVPRVIFTMLLLQLPFTALGLLLPREMDQTLPLLLFFLAVWIVYRWVERMIRETGGCRYE